MAELSFSVLRWHSSSSRAGSQSVFSSTCDVSSEVLRDKHTLHAHRRQCVCVCVLAVAWGDNWIWEEILLSWKIPSHNNGSRRNIPVLLCQSEPAGSAGPCPSFSGEKAAGKRHACCCAWWCVHASCIAEAWISRHAPPCVASSNTPAPGAWEKKLVCS